MTLNELCTAEVDETRAFAGGTDALRAIDVCWRAANDISIRQIYLPDDPQLRPALSLAGVEPAAVTGFAFQDDPLATAHLDIINRRRLLDKSLAPSPLVFSVARVVPHPAMKLGRGNDVTGAAAQAAGGHRVRCCHAPNYGRYDVAMQAATL